MIEPPPVIPQASGARWQQWLSVLPMLAGTFATAMMFGGREGASAYTYVVGAIFGLSTLGMLVTSWSGGGPRKAELVRARRDYLRYLSGVRHRLRTVVADQRAAARYRHPEPDALWAVALGGRVWERRSSDADFGVIRVAVGPQALAITLVAPAVEAVTDPEPVTYGAVHRLVQAYSIVPDLPVAVALCSFARIVLTDGSAGGRAARDLARAMLGQLATFHGPEDLVIAACVGPGQRSGWEWLKWLPHALHPTEVDAVGPRRLVADRLTDLDHLLADLLSGRPRLPQAGSGPGHAAGAWPASGTDRLGFRTGVAPGYRPGSLPGYRPEPGDPDSGPPAAPRLVVLIDGGDATASAHLGRDGGLAGVTVIELGAPMPLVPDRATIVLSVEGDGTLHSTTVDSRTQVGPADRLTAPEAEALARRLAPLRLAGASREQAPLGADHDLMQLLGIDDITRADPMRLWARRGPRQFLRVPIGTDGDGEPVELDLKESAQDGMGPHGLVIGATGSGKSELLRTLVLGLAVSHSSEVLNFVLIDFKGGATFATLDRLPHTSAVITNLADELPLVDRMTDALNGELVRRQELLRRAGNFSSVRDYDRARAAGAPLPPLASLLVICDEFTELLAAKPDFIDLFLQIGRVGRSLAMHLLLASQRLEEGRLRGLETHLSYRIGLRTFTSMESRAVLGVPDAHELPPAPGHGFLRVGTEPLRRFRAAYVSGPYRRVVSGSQPITRRFRRYGILPYPTQEVAPADAATEPGPVVETVAESLLDLVVDRFAAHGPAAHRVWLAPLSEPPGVDELLGGLVADAKRGLAGAHPSWGTLRVPVALVDRPFDQRRDVHWLDLSGAAGHVAIVGAPQSGKSTAARTLVTALALTHTPRQVQIYCLDFGGGSLAALRSLPHVGGVALRLDAAAVRRTVGEVTTLLADREGRFAAHGIDSMATVRRARGLVDPDTAEAGSASTLAGLDAFGDVVVVIDGWATLRNEYEDLESVLADIATRGLSYGIHLVATATRWLDLRGNVRDLFGSRLELRLGDPAESAVGRRSAANVPQAAPGRGLTPDGLHLLMAEPRATAHDPAALVRAVAAAWTGPPAPPVRMLPELVTYSAVLGGGDDGSGLPIGTGLALPLGIAEADLRPVLVDFAAEPHLVAFGDSGCGKSSLLRCLAESIVRRFTPEQARIVLVDYRRSLLGAVRTDHLIGYGTTAEDTAALIESVAGYLARRRAGPDVTPEQRRARSWWTGPECFVLVDDYDLVAAGSANPVLALLEHLAHARDVGLHLVLVRRAGGAGRALYEPVLQRLRELGAPGLVMAGDRDEGALVGAARPGVLPPGRGWLVTRKDGVRLIQLAFVEESG